MHKVWGLVVEEELSLATMHSKHTKPTHQRLSTHIAGSENCQRDIITVDFGSCGPWSLGSVHGLPWAGAEQGSAAQAASPLDSSRCGMKESRSDWLFPPSGTKWAGSP